MFEACDETGTVINMHIGSGSKMITTSADAPILAGSTLQVLSATAGFVDWLASGVLERYPGIKIAISEGQVGWMPYFLERMDSLWRRANDYDATTRERVPHPPSSYVAGRIFGCIFDDLHGLASRDEIGMGQIMFETDYPHADSTFPKSRDAVRRLVDAAGLSEHQTWQLLRGNAIACYDLQRVGLSE
jgi:predicted TIM-barrel fold metal-dependent hydrolase